MATNSSLAKRLDMINEQQDGYRHRQTSFLAKSFKINYQSADNKSKQDPLRRISKTVNIFDKSNDQLAVINQNIINGEEDQSASRVVQFEANKLKIYQMVGPITLRKKILKIDDKSSQKKLFLDTKGTLGTKFNTSFHDTNLKNKLKLQPVEQVNKTATNITNMNQTVMNQTGMNSTIQRSSILSKREKDEQNVYTKDYREINRYKDYKSEWQRQSSNIKNKSNSHSLNIRKPYSAVQNLNQINNSDTQKYQSRPHSITLIDRAVKPMYIQPNRDRQDIINNNVTRYWEMSLRNHNKQLLQYMKGTNYDGCQFQELLQTSGGLKQLQKSIPTLDFRARSEMAVHEGQKLSLSGKRKFDKQKQSMIASTNRRINEVEQQIDLMKDNPDLKLNSTKKTKFNDQKSGIKSNMQSTYGSGIKKLAVSQQEVYKISYDGRKHWLGTEGL